MSVAVQQTMDNDVGPAGFGSQSTSEDQESGMDGNTHLTRGIKKPGPHDVLLGRGGGTNNHSGNVKFRQLVNEHKMHYLASSKVDKPKVAREVVSHWRKLKPPGRFLQRMEEGKRGASSVKDENIFWLEVNDKKSREKASQCLRERTPDVLPYLSQLRHHQNELTEQGVSMVERQLKLNKPTPDFAGSEMEVAVQDTRLTNMPDGPTSFSMSTLRRGSMPVMPRSTSYDFAGGPSPSGMRTHNRRTSAPTVNHLQGHRPQTAEMKTMMVRQQQVLREAYTVIERSSKINPSSVASMHMQGQYMKQPYNGYENQMAQMQNIQTLRHQIMAQQEQQRCMMGASRSTAYVQANEQAQCLAQQQQYLVQERQRLLAEQEYIMQQEQQLLAKRQGEEAARLQQVMEQKEEADVGQKHKSKFSRPSNALSASASKCDTSSFNEDIDFEPLPYKEDGGSPKAQAPDVLTSESASGMRLDSSQENAAGSEEVREAPTEAGAGDALGKGKGTLDSSLNQEAEKETREREFSIRVTGKEESTSSSAGIVESEHRIATLAESKTQEHKLADEEHRLREYRQTLENYINNSQIADPNLDIDDDVSNDGCIEIEGFDRSEWLQQALEDSGEISHSKGGRKLHRTNSKKSLMSLGTSSEHMSLAFSDMDHSIDLSKGDGHKKYTTRSMSIVSAHSLMSELTDFDELDCF